MSPDNARAHLLRPENTTIKKNTHRERTDGVVMNRILFGDRRSPELSLCGANPICTNLRGSSIVFESGNGPVNKFRRAIDMIWIVDQLCR